MKTIKILAIITIALSFSLISCQKDPGVLIKENTKDNSHFENNHFNQIKILTKDFTGHMGSNNMLCFPNMDCFKSVLKDLRKMSLDYNNAIMDKYKGLNSDALNEKLIELNYIEDYPLFVFENRLQFQSLHKQIYEKEIEYLKQDYLYIEKDPDNHFVVEKEVRTLLNQDCEVKINDTIYKLTEKGYISICDGKMKSLQIIDKNFNQIISIPNVIYSEEYLNSRAEGCNTNERNSGYKTVNNHRIKWVVSHWTHPWDKRVIAKIDNYYKKGAFLNTWVKQSAYCFCKVYGFISGYDSQANANCDVQLNFNPSNNGLYHPSAQSLSIE